MVRRGEITPFCEMAEIQITAAYKFGIQELYTGDFKLTFKVDATLAKEVLPLMLVSQDQPLRLVVSDSDWEKKPTEKTPEQHYREGLYARIQMHSDNAGYTEEAMRDLFERITGKRSRKEMSVAELEAMEAELYKEANPIGEPG